MHLHCEGTETNVTGPPGTGSMHLASLRFSGVGLRRLLSFNLAKEEKKHMTALTHAQDLCFTNGLRALRSCGESNCALVDTRVRQASPLAGDENRALPTPTHREDLSILTRRAEPRPAAAVAQTCEGVSDDSAGK